MFSSHRQRLQLFFGSNKSFPRFTYFCSVRLVPLLVLLFASFQNFETGINASAQLFSSSNSEIACSPSIDMFASPISRSLNVLRLLCYRTTVLIISWSAIVPLQKPVTVFSACWAIVRSSSFLLWLEFSTVWLSPQRTISSLAKQDHMHAFHSHTRVSLFSICLEF